MQYIQLPLRWVSHHSVWTAADQCQQLSKSTTGGKAGEARTTTTVSQPVGKHEVGREWALKIRAFKFMEVFCPCLHEKHWTHGLHSLSTCSRVGITALKRGQAIGDLPPKVILTMINNENNLKCSRFVFPPISHNVKADLLFIFRSNDGYFKPLYTLIFTGNYSVLYHCS